MAKRDKKERSLVTNGGTAFFAHQLYRDTRLLEAAEFLRPPKTGTPERGTEDTDDEEEFMELDMEAEGAVFLETVEKDVDNRATSLYEKGRKKLLAFRDDMVERIQQFRAGLINDPVRDMQKAIESESGERGGTAIVTGLVAAFRQVPLGASDEALAMTAFADNLVANPLRPTQSLEYRTAERLRLEATRCVVIASGLHALFEDREDGTDESFDRALRVGALLLDLGVAPLLATRAGMEDLVSLGDQREHTSAHAMQRWARILLGIAVRRLEPPSGIRLSSWPRLLDNAKDVPLGLGDTYLPLDDTEKETTAHIEVARELMRSAVAMEVRLNALPVETKDDGDIDIAKGSEAILDRMRPSRRNEPTISARADRITAVVTLERALALTPLLLTLARH